MGRCGGGRGDRWRCGKRGRRGTNGTGLSTAGYTCTVYIYVYMYTIVVSSTYIHVVVSREMCSNPGKSYMSVH